MLIKHLKNIDVEDEFIKVSKSESVFNIAKKLMDVRKERSCEADSDDLICAPILAAYVVDRGKPVGVIYEENIMEEVILNGKDPKKLKAMDVMKPPISVSINQEIREAVNIIIDKGILTLAVCDGNKLVSVISVFDAIFLNEDISEI